MFYQLPSQYEPSTSGLLRIYFSLYSNNVHQILVLLTNICSFLSSGPRTFDVRREPMTCFEQWNVTGSDSHHFRAETWKNQCAALHILHIPASISGCWWGFSQVFFAGWCAHLAAAVTAGVLLSHSCPYLSRTKSTKSEASQRGQAQLCHE